jgi:hypothetical protein
VKDTYTDEEVAKIALRTLSVLTAIQRETEDVVVFREMRSDLTETVRMLRSGLLPEEVHEHWCEVARENGWLYGPDFDPQDRQDPRLVKYYDLPAYLRRRYDVLHGLIVNLTI